MRACLLAVAFGQRTLEQVSGLWRVGPGKEPADWASSQGAPLIPLVLGDLKGSQQAFVHIDAEKRLVVTNGTAPADSIASAKWNDTIEQVGWAYLHVSTTDGSAANDDLAMYAAGVLEGALSRKRISQFHHNANKGMAGMEESHHALSNMEKLFSTETATLRAKVGLPVDKDWEAEPKAVFDRYVRNVFLQTWGVLDGYNAATTDPDDKMSLVDLFILNSDGETPELEMALDMEETLLRQSTREDPSADTAELSFLQRPSARAVRREEELRDLTPAKWRDIKRTSGRCSALVRLAETTPTSSSATRRSRTFQRCCGCSSTTTSR
jgi:hypothetical protein